MPDLGEHSLQEGSLVPAQHLTAMELRCSTLSVCAPVAITPSGDNTVPEPAQVPLQRK